VSNSNEDNPWIVQYFREILTLNNKKSKYMNAKLVQLKYGTVYGIA
jgi:hypothetical protein